MSLGQTTCAAIAAIASIAAIALIAAIASIASIAAIASISGRPGLFMARGLLSWLPMAAVLQPKRWGVRGRASDWERRLPADMVAGASSSHVGASLATPAPTIGKLLRKQGVASDAPTYRHPAGSSTGFQPVRRRGSVAKSPSPRAGSPCYAEPAGSRRSQSLARFLASQCACNLSRNNS